MKQKVFTIETEFTFKGKFYVKATCINEAEQIVKNSCAMRFGSIHSNDNDSVDDWDFNMTPEKSICSTNDGESVRSYKKRMEQEYRELKSAY